MAGRPDVGVDPAPVDRPGHAVRSRRIVRHVDRDHGNRRCGDRRVAVEGGVENDPVGCGGRVGEGVGDRPGEGDADGDVDPGPLGPAAQQDAEQVMVDLVAPLADEHGEPAHDGTPRRTSGRTRRPIRSMPASSVRPCGVPRSTRLAPAASTALTRAATCSGVPLKAKRSSTSSGTKRPACVVLAGVDELAHGLEHLGWDVERRVELGDDGEVHRHLDAGPRTGTLAVLVDDADGAEHDADVVGSRPAAPAPAPMYRRITPTIAGFAEPPTLTSSAMRPASSPVRRPQVPISSGIAGRQRLVAQRRPGGEPERRAGVAVGVVAQQRGDEAGRLLQGLYRSPLLDADGAEPGAAGESEERPPVRRRGRGRPPVRRSRTGAASTG